MIPAKTLPFSPLIQGAIDRVRYAIPQHVALAYINMLPFLCLLIAGPFDDLLATFVSRQPVGNALSQGLLFLLPVLLWSSTVTVMWYRLTLLGPAEFLRIDRPTAVTRIIRFIGVAVLVGLLAGIALFVTLAAGSLVLMLVHRGLQPLALLAALIVALYVTLRFVPSLAAVPLGRAIPLRVSWNITQDNGWTLLLASGALIFPVLIVGGLVEGLLGAALLNTAPAASADMLERMAHLRQSLLISFVCAPLSGAANALMLGLGAETYTRLIGPPLDARGIEV